MSGFDYTNPEEALSSMHKKEEARREEIYARNRIPDNYNVDSRVKEIKRGVSKKGDPKWEIEVSLRDRGESWDKATRNLHFSEGSDWLMGRFWDIVKAWGINPAWVPTALKKLEGYGGMSDDQKRKEAVLILMGFIEDAIEAGAQLPLVTEHKPDKRDPQKTQINFMERLDDIPVVFDEEAPAVEEESQEVAEETEPEPEEETPVEKPAAEKPARTRPRSPYAKRPSTAV